MRNAAAEAARSKPKLPVVVGEHFRDAIRMFNAVGVEAHVEKARHGKDVLSRADKHFPNDLKLLSPCGENGMHLEIDERAIVVAAIPARIGKP